MIGRAEDGDWEVSLCRPSTVVPFSLLIILVQRQSPLDEGSPPGDEGTAQDEYTETKVRNGS
jgi:hypothetical protein